LKATQLLLVLTSKGEQMFMRIGKSSLLLV